MYYYSPNIQRRQITYNRPASRLPGTLAALALFFVTLSGAWLSFSTPKNDAPVVKVKQAASAKAAPEPIVPVVPTISAEEMSARINAIIAANLDTDIGVAITDLKTGQTYRYGLTEVFEAASIGKLITAADYLRQVEAGKRSLDTVLAGKTAREHIRLMIEESDNTSWRIMNDTLTRDSLRQYAQSIGMKTYDPDKNYIAVDDINLLVTRLYTNKLLNKTHTKLLLAHMKIANENMYIPPAVPKDIAVYHKAGILEDRVHDAAVIDNGSRPYTLVIFTNGQKRYHPTDRAALVQSITKATLEHFVRSETQPVQP